MTKIVGSQTAALLFGLILLLAACPSGTFAQSNMSAAEMVRILSQRSVDLRARENAAPPDIKQLLATLRGQIRETNATFTVSYTPVLDVPLEMLAGTVIPRDSNLAPEVNARAEALVRADQDSARRSRVAVPAPAASTCSEAAHYDWRTENKVTPVRSQLACGSCWAFSAMAAYEASYAIRNSQLVDTSEQYVLNCSKGGDCKGGWWMPVFDYMMSHGNTSEAVAPYAGKQLACVPNVKTPFRASAWGFAGKDQKEIPKVEAIKAAICQHGPVATAVYTDKAFQAYTGGVFDEHTQKFDWINHGVLIIGWDDAKHAWLIKNSWGTSWGETGGYGTSKGYMWISYDTNNIGIATAWVDAKNSRYPLVDAWAESLGDFQITPRPVQSVPSPACDAFGGCNR